MCGVLFPCLLYAIEDLVLRCGGKVFISIFLTVLYTLNACKDYMTIKIILELGTTSVRECPSVRWDSWFELCLTRATKR